MLKVPFNSNRWRAYAITFVKSIYQRLECLCHLHRLNQPKKVFAFWFLTTYIESNRVTDTLTYIDAREDNCYGHN